MMRDLRHYYAGALLYLVVVLGACTALGLSTPQTFNQKLVYAYGSVTSVRMTAKDLLNKGSITVEEAKDAQAKAEVIRQTLDAARAARSIGDVTTAEGKLAAAQGALTLLQDFIKSKGGTP